jgi:hypothetical protein
MRPCLLANFGTFPIESLPHDSGRTLVPAEYGYPKKKSYSLTRHNCLRPLQHRDRGFESHWRHGCLCVYPTCRRVRISTVIRPSRKRRRKGNSVVTGETVMYGYESSATLTTDRLHYKLQTRPLVRESPCGGG